MTARGETARRVLVALPLIALAIAVIVAGGLAFAATLIAFGALALAELFRMAAPARPLAPAAYIVLIALVLAAHYGAFLQIVLVGAASLPLMFGFALLPPRRRHVTYSMAITVFGLAWIAAPMVHAMLLRDLPEHGAGLVVDVLIGTFLADTAAYTTGRMFGTRRIAPRISPGKTLEGLAGGLIGGIGAVWLAGLYQDWLSGADALILGAAVAAATPLGDLFESFVKRDLGAKDTGGIFGPHGGVLDRIDAALFTVVVGYYVSRALVL